MKAARIVAAGILGVMNLLALPVHAQPSRPTLSRSGAFFERDRDDGSLPTVRFDPAAIEAAGYSPLSPVILPDLPDGYRIEKTTAATVQAGQDVLFTVTRPD